MCRSVTATITSSIWPGTLLTGIALKASWNEDSYLVAMDTADMSTFKGYRELAQIIELDHELIATFTSMLTAQSYWLVFPAISRIPPALLRGKMWSVAS